MDQPGAKGGGSVNSVACKIQRGESRRAEEGRGGGGALVEESFGPVEGCRTRVT